MAHHDTAPTDLSWADGLQPDWPAPVGVHAFFTTRSGGCSAAPFDRLNLGDHVGDQVQAVQTNRRALQVLLRSVTPEARAIFLRQVHGCEAVHLQPGVPDGTQADACYTSTPGSVCTIMVADCLPVLLAHRRVRVVAAAHAGWRGLAGQQGGGILEEVFKGFSSLTQVQQAQAAPENIAKDTLAWLGPCIGPQAFEVGPEVRAAFCADDAGAQTCFHPGESGKYFADLPALARRRLAALGITRVYGNDGSPAWCTVAQASRFFSHRRDAGRLGSTGRMAACIWLS